jgi:sigma-B regulation protein RsbU (phosphoserine phosphatase)
MFQRHGWQWVLWALLLLCALDFKRQDLPDRIGLLTHPKDYAVKALLVAGAPPRVIVLPGRKALGRAAREAGFEPGDIVRRIDGKEVRNQRDLRTGFEWRKPGERIEFTVERNGRLLTLGYDVKSLGGLQGSEVGLAVVMQVCLPALLILTGFFLAGVRIYDPRAWAAMFMLIGFGGFFDQTVRAAVNTIPAVAYQMFSFLAWPLAMSWFALLFPDALERPRWLKWTLRILIGLNAAMLGLYVLETVLEEIAFSVAVPAWNLLHATEWLLYLAMYAGVGGFFYTMWSRRFSPETKPDSKRRLRILLAGGTAGLTPLLLVGVYQLVAAGQGWPLAPQWVVIPVWLIVAAFPLSLAYVLIVDRALDLQVVVRTGVRYALARGGVMVLIGLVLAGIVIWAAWSDDFARLSRPQRIQRLATPLIAMGVLMRLRERLFTWVDKRFFREAYDSEQILIDLSHGVREILDKDELVNTLGVRVSESLRVPQVGVLLRTGDRLRLAHGPQVELPERLASFEKMREGLGPLTIYWDDPKSWVYQGGALPEAEKAALNGLGTQVLVPLLGKGEVLGALSLGAKKSEAPYSQTDLRLLQTVANQAALALENARLTDEIAQQAAQRERLNRELEIAREVQTRLFPQMRPKAGLDYFGYCRPALGVGGDYYDFLEFANGQFGIAIGDVSGKGIGAALTMASLQASLRAQTIDPTDDLSRVIGNVNRLLYEASASNRYATFFYAQYDPASSTLVYVNAGHNPPMLVRHGELMRHGEVVRLDAGGAVIGLLPKFPYVQARVTVEPGDLLFGFTDGISEAMNSADEEWGEDWLSQTLQAMNGLPCSEVVQRVLRAADEHIAGAPQHDDMTMVAVRF